MFHSNSINSPHARLLKTRQILSGKNEYGVKRFNAMTDPSVLSLAHGDGTRRPHPSVITNAIRHCFTLDGWSFDDYHFMKQYEPLLSAVRESWLGLLTQQAKSASISIDAGTSRLFSTYLTIHAQPGDILLVPRPYYHGIVDWCAATGVEPFVVLTEQDTDYKVTVDDLNRSLQSINNRRICGLLIANPTFTGAIFSQRELDSIVSWTKREGINLLYDAIFRGTEFHQPQSELRLDLGMDSSGILVFGGVSKAYNLANLRVGWVVGDHKLVGPMEEYRERTMGTVPFLCQAMATAALQTPSEYLLQNAVECKERVKIIYDLVKDLNHSLAADTIQIEHCPHAGHGLLISAHSLTGTTLPDGTQLADSVDLCRHLLWNHGLAISPSYSQGFDGIVFRIAFGSIGLQKTYADALADEEIILTNIINVQGNARFTSDICTAPEIGFLEGRKLLCLAFERLYDGLVAVKSQRMK